MGEEPTSRTFDCWVIFIRYLWNRTRILFIYILQKFHTGRELLVRINFVYTARRRGNAESYQRPRPSRRLLGVRRPHVGHIYSQPGGFFDRRKNASMYHLKLYHTKSLLYRRKGINGGKIIKDSAPFSFYITTWILFITNSRIKQNICQQKQDKYHTAYW